MAFKNTFMGRCVFTKESPTTFKKLIFNKEKNFLMLLRVQAVVQNTEIK